MTVEVYKNNIEVKTINSIEGSDNEKTLIEFLEYMKDKEIISCELFLKEGSSIEDLSEILNDNQPEKLERQRINIK